MPRLQAGRVYCVEATAYKHGNWWLRLVGHRENRRVCCDDRGVPAFLFRLVGAVDDAPGEPTTATPAPTRPNVTMTAEVPEDFEAHALGLGLTAREYLWLLAESSIAEGIKVVRITRLKPKRKGAQ